MENVKKKFLILFSSCAFVALMMFNVSVSMEDTGVSPDISLSGIATQAHEAIEDPGNGGTVQCRCAWWWFGNNDCRADNNGNTCSQNNTDCRAADAQCGD
jgi:hypothetical protein